MKLMHKSVEVVDNSACGYFARIDRKLARRTLEYVAKKMGVSKAFVSDLELGRRNWTQDRVEEFKRALK